MKNADNFFYSAIENTQFRIKSRQYIYELSRNLLRGSR